MIHQGDLRGGNLLVVVMKRIWRWKSQVLVIVEKKAGVIVVVEEVKKKMFVDVDVEKLKKRLIIVPIKKYVMNVLFRTWVRPVMGNVIAVLKKEIYTNKLFRVKSMKVTNNKSM
jgi:hypothetical protein